MTISHTAPVEALRDTAAREGDGPAPICVACVGDATDPATGRPCLRCQGTGIDPDPLAPTVIAVPS